MRAKYVCPDCLYDSEFDEGDCPTCQGALDEVILCQSPECENLPMRGDDYCSECVERFEALEREYAQAMEERL